MKATSAAVLEYESLRALLGRYVSSPPGKAELAKIVPHTDAARLAADLADAGEAVEYIRSAGRPQTGARGAAIRIEFGGFPDLTEAVHKLRIEGASLEGKEIFDLFGVLDRAADAKSVLNAVAERFPRLGARAQSIRRISARCSRIWKARSSPMDPSPTMPVWRLRACAATSSASASPSKDRSSAS